MASVALSLLLNWQPFTMTLQAQVAILGHSLQWIIQGITFISTSRHLRRIGTRVSTVRLSSCVPRTSAMVCGASSTRHPRATPSLKRPRSLPVRTRANQTAWCAHSWTQHLALARSISRARVSYLESRKSQIQGMGATDRQVPTQRKQMASSIPSTTYPRINKIDW